MIDYARISRILDYAERGLWPHTAWPGQPLWRRLGHRIRDAGRLLMGTDPLRLTSSHPLAGSTRSWEYPWVYERIINLPKGARILDCGCGSGLFPFFLASKGYLVTGLDYFDENPLRGNSAEFRSIKVKKAAHIVDYKEGGIENIPFPEEMFDAVLCISVMEHIVIDHADDPGFHYRCLDEMKRVLKPGGILVCTYDTILNPDVVFAGEIWGKDGWWYLNDIEYTGMALLDPQSRRYKRNEIILDEDAFFVPPERYLTKRYGSGFRDFGPYHRLTSVGYALVK